MPSFEDKVFIYVNVKLLFTFYVWIQISILQVDGNSLKRRAIRENAAGYIRNCLNWIGIDSWVIFWFSNELSLKQIIERTAASTLAGESRFGSANIEITERRIVSTVCTGNHLSSGFSYPHWSSPGACNIEMHTLPFLSTKAKNVAISHF